MTVKRELFQQSLHMDNTALQQRKLKVILVDDQVNFRNVLKTILPTISHVEIIAEAGNGEEFLEKIKKQIPDVVFMDIEMPVMNGIDATRIAMTKYRNLNIIALSFHGDFDNVSKMLSAGARNYMVKDEMDMETLEKVLFSDIK
jgi:YesN/AraC family two-component response regulator